MTAQSTTSGKLFGVGVGPGDPELITRKAERILREVDLIYHPAARNDSFVRRIVADLGLPESKFRSVSLCMSRTRDADVETYGLRADEIAAELRQGRSAAWLTEGDPLFYSTFFHLFVAMRSRHDDIAIEVVPGVTSMQAAGAAGQLPLALLDERLAVLPAGYGLESLPTLLDGFATIVLVKVHGVLDELIGLLENRPGVQALFVEKVGTPEERLVADLSKLRGQQVSYFSLVILRQPDVGQVSNLTWGRFPTSHESTLTAPEFAPHGTASVDAGSSIPLPATQSVANVRSHAERGNKARRERGNEVEVGALTIAGLGPGSASLLTPQAALALRQADVIVGYQGYFAAVAGLIADKEHIALELGEERRRARRAVDCCLQGRSVCVISSGDAGVYGMAGLVLEAADAARTSIDIEVIPGVSAVNACAALLGAPLGHDFAVISLSDLWTPWPAIEKKLAAAASADFVVALLNPRSAKRDWQLGRACELLLKERGSDTPAGIVRHAFRPEQSVEIVPLAKLPAARVDMFTTVIIGNSQTRQLGVGMVTPRGIGEDQSEVDTIPPRTP